MRREIRNDYFERLLVHGFQIIILGIQLNKPKEKITAIFLFFLSKKPFVFPKKHIFAPLFKKAVP